MNLKIGAITGPGSSKKNRTGDWSYFIPKVDKEKCNGCGICELFCPENCIDIIDNMCIVENYYCKGCGICVEECAQEAIIMVKKEGVN